MHDAHERAPEGPFDSRVAPFDRDIQVKPIVVIGAIGAAVTLLCILVSWWLFIAFKGHEVAKDPAPSPIPEANVPHQPPAPNLQEFPSTADIKVFHAWEDELLNGYAMVDPGARVARIPIARAMELVLERGFPARAVPASDLVPAPVPVDTVPGDTVATPTEVHVEPPPAH